MWPNHISKALKAQQSFIAFGPFCSLQVDSWTHDSCDFVYAVASASFITPAFEVQRFGLDVQSFRQGRFTAPAVATWLERITEEYFQTLTPAQVFVSCTIGEGEPPRGGSQQAQHPGHKVCRHPHEQGLQVCLHFKRP